MNTKCRIFLNLLLFNFSFVYGDVIKRMRMVELPNEECSIRKQVVNVDIPSMAHYSPMMVTVNRCEGVADGINPILKGCIKDTFETLRFPVQDTYNSKHVIYRDIENHLTCKGKCRNDASVCKGASAWDEKSCRCRCIVHRECPVHFIWDPNKCACVCNRTCHRRQVLDTEDCTCTCKGKFFKRCTKRGLVPNPRNCLCRIVPKTSSSCAPCRCKKSLDTSFLLRRSS